jgi:hypothetical protein
MQKDNVDMIWNKRNYAQIYKDEHFEMLCCAMYYKLETSVEVGMDTHVHTYT